jgi:hypothetical protein
MRMMHSMLVTLSLVGVAACMENADGTARPVEGQEEVAGGVVPDSMQPLTSHRPSSDQSNVLGAPGPIAYGTLWFDGTKQSGSANVTSTWNATSKWYEITIAGESYFYLSYATVVSTVDPPTCRPNSVSGKLLIICTDSAGAQVQARVSFTTFK